MSDTNPLVTEIKKEMLLRICEEGIARIKKCLAQLSEEEVWKKYNSNIPSIANLILHLNGNVRQWFLDGFCGLSYTRMRENEFSAEKSLTKIQLLEIISTLEFDIQTNIHLINNDLLLRKKVIQKHFDVSGLSIIMHVIEHFSYHVGQITTLTKLSINRDLGYYENLNL